MSEDPRPIGELVDNVLTAMRDATPRVGQVVEIRITGMLDLPVLVGTVTSYDTGEMNQAYVTSEDFDMWVSARAWGHDPMDQTEVFAVKVLPS